MKSLSFQNIMDQKRIPLHILAVILSLIVVIIYSVNMQVSIFHKEHLYLFVSLLLQIELFVFIGERIFRGFKPGHTRKEFTRSVLIRFLFFMVLCFIIAFLVAVIFIWFKNIIHGFGSKEAIMNFVKYELAGWFKATFGGLIFGAAIFIFMQWQDALKREQKLREENLIFQNETLKNQVNPHFLFNSLNTLSALISTQPEAAEKFINRLSSIYRYILENSSSDKVPLKEELSFVRDYFYLHKIRGEEKIELEVNVNEPEKYEILPISLQGLIENAIKHNKATREDPLKIMVYIEGPNIVVKNNLQRMATQVRSTGIGLKNLAERIQLISGRNLTVEETNNYFLVKLPLFS